MGEKTIAEEFKLKKIEPDNKLKHYNTIQAFVRKMIKQRKDKRREKDDDS